MRSKRELLAALERIRRDKGDTVGFEARFQAGLSGLAHAPAAESRDGRAGLAVMGCARVLRGG